MNLRLIVPLLLAVFITACAPIPRLLTEDWLQDASLIISEDPCAAPCWLGIVPGETSYTTALEILEADGRFTSIDEINADDGTQQVNFNFGEGIQCCSIIAETGETVTHILLFLSTNQPDAADGRLTLRSVLDVYGEPTYLQGEVFSDDQTWITAVYPEIPMLVYVYGTSFDEATLDGTNPVFGTLYMTESEMEELLSSVNLYSWTGFAAVSEIFDGNFDLTAEPETTNTE